MKRLFTAMILVLLTHVLIAQEVSDQDKNNISQRLEKYTQLTNKGNWKALVEYIYPELFTVIPKEILIGAFSSFSSKGIEMSMDEMNVKSFEMLGKSNEETYVALPYSTYIYMTFSKDANSMMPMVKEQIILQFGDENLSFEEDGNKFTIFQEKTILAVFVKNKGDWYFVDYEDNKEDILKQILPEDIIEKLKALK